MLLILAEANAFNTGGAYHEFPKWGRRPKAADPIWGGAAGGRPPLWRRPKAASLMGGCLEAG